jgi:hypothetical protein
MSDLIPNSFQTPNAYVDRFMYLVTAEEWKVLSYAARRIFGFQKRQDRISQSQFIHGTVSTKDGAHLDHGTGLSKPAVIKALQGLIAYRILIKISDNDQRFKDGTLYELQLDSNQIDIAGLIQRANQANSINQQRSLTARQRAAEKRIGQDRSVPLTGSDGERSVSPTDQDRSAPLTRIGQSDRPGSVSGTDTQNQGETKEKPRGKPRESGADAPAPVGAPKPAKSSRKKSATKEPDPLLQHPAVIAYRDVMHLTPNAIQRDEIASVVGNNGRVEDWKMVLRDWQLSGYKPSNVAGQLDKFKKAIGAHHDATTGPAHTGTTTPAEPTDEQRAAAERINAARAAKQH